MRTPNATENKCTSGNRAGHLCVCIPRVYAERARGRQTLVGEEKGKMCDEKWRQPDQVD